MPRSLRISAAEFPNSGNARQRLGSIHTAWGGSNLGNKRSKRWAKERMPQTPYLGAPTRWVALVWVAPGFHPGATFVAGKLASQDFLSGVSACKRVDLGAEALPGETECLQ